MFANSFYTLKFVVYTVQLIVTIIQLVLYSTLVSIFYPETIRTCITTFIFNFRSEEAPLKETRRFQNNIGIVR